MLFLALYTLSLLVQRIGKKVWLKALLPREWISRTELVSCVLGRERARVLAPAVHHTTLQREQGGNGMRS